MTALLPRQLGYIGPENVARTTSITTSLKHKLAKDAVPLRYKYARFLVFHANW